jgi:hypothetical protein
MLLGSYFTFPFAVPRGRRSGTDYRIALVVSTVIVAAKARAVSISVGQWLAALTRDLPADLPALALRAAKSNGAPRCVRRQLNQAFNRAACQRR